MEQILLKKLEVVKIIQPYNTSMIQIMKLLDLHIITLNIYI